MRYTRAASARDKMYPILVVKITRVKLNGEKKKKNSTRHNRFDSTVSRARDIALSGDKLLHNAQGVSPRICPLRDLPR